MLNIILVEDDPLFAVTLKHLIELNPCHVVTAMADDYEGALAAVGQRRPDLALVDLQLARGSTGFSVAAKLRELGIACVFISGKVPSFPIPDLALGCLVKPFREEDLVLALKTAEDILRGRRSLRPGRAGHSERLWLYEVERESAAERQEAPPPTRTRSRRGWQERLGLSVLRRRRAG